MIGTPTTKMWYEAGQKTAVDLEPAPPAQGTDWLASFRRPDWNTKKDLDRLTLHLAKDWWQSAEPEISARGRNVLIRLAKDLTQTRQVIIEAQRLIGWRTRWPDVEEPHFYGK